MKYLTLNKNTWDLILDPIGNIAIIENELEEINQTVCCMIRTFRGECIFDGTRGIPYFSVTAGRYPNGTNMENYISHEIARTYADEKIKSLVIANIEYNNRIYREEIEITLKKNDRSNYR